MSPGSPASSAWKWPPLISVAWSNPSLILPRQMLLLEGLILCPAVPHWTICGAGGGLAYAKSLILKGKIEQKKLKKTLDKHSRSVQHSVPMEGSIAHLPVADAKGIKGRGSNRVLSIKHRSAASCNMEGGSNMKSVATKVVFVAVLSAGLAWLGPAVSAADETEGGNQDTQSTVDQLTRQENKECTEFRHDPATDMMVSHCSKEWAELGLPLSVGCKYPPPGATANPWLSGAASCPGDHPYHDQTPWIHGNSSSTNYVRLCNNGPDASAPVTEAIISGYVFTGCLQLWAPDPNGETTGPYLFLPWKQKDFQYLLEKLDRDKLELARKGEVGPDWCIEAPPRWSEAQLRRVRKGDAIEEITVERCVGKPCLGTPNGDVCIVGQEREIDPENIPEPDPSLQVYGRWVTTRMLGAPHILCSRRYKTGNKVLVAEKGPSNQLGFSYAYRSNGSGDVDPDSFQIADVTGKRCSVLNQVRYDRIGFATTWTRPYESDPDRVVADRVVPDSISDAISCTREVSYGFADGTTYIARYHIELQSICRHSID